MKKAAAFLIVLFCFASAISAQKTRFGKPLVKANPAEYTIPVHVSVARVVPECPSPEVSQCGSFLVLEVTIAGTKYELQGGLVGGKVGVLAPGDYKARVASEFRNPSGVFGRVYELLLLDNSAWQGVVSGISE